MWLKDFLHLDLPKARIMTFCHSLKWRRDATVKDLSDYGKQLLSAIEGVRSTEKVI